ncbi:hypothetical protein ALC53_06045 [Atta colombica]|uniref:Uncharacterized protein n=1 Tax=Atta colombica TaxID=520822 RepID=A0A195BHE0_9HYME|nr:hypothetical protein ALC53_06045 [Atta colombica]
MLFLKDKLYNALRIVYSHCGNGKTITLYFKIIVFLLSFFFLIPLPCKQFREQCPGKGLHSRWDKKSRRREKERKRQRDVQDENNEGKEMVERMVRTVIRGRLRRGARTFTLNSHLVNAYTAHGSSPFVSNWLENYLRNDEKWNDLIMFVERVLMSEIKQTVCVFNLSHARRTKRNESMKAFQ